MRLAHLTQAKYVQTHLETSVCFVCTMYMAFYNSTSMASSSATIGSVCISSMSGTAAFSCEASSSLTGSETAKDGGLNKTSAIEAAPFFFMMSSTLPSYNGREALRLRCRSRAEEMDRSAFESAYRSDDGCCSISCLYSSSSSSESRSVMMIPVCVRNRE